MFDKIKNVLKNNAERVAFDTGRFNDPLADQIQWTPIKGGGSNFRTHKYFAGGSNQAGFKATKGAMLFSGFFILAGLGVAIGIPFSMINDGLPLLAWETFFVILFGLVFMIVGLVMYRSFSKPIIFDKMVGYFWKGWKKPDRYRRDKGVEGSIRIDDIHALQIVAEYIRGDKSSYYSYELNIVTRDGKRHNVIDHGDQSDMVADANKLSEFLGVPVWDAT